MCPAVTTWEAVSKAIDIAQKFVYVSLIADLRKTQLSTKSWHFRRRKSTYDGGYVLFITVVIL